jgi:hypothetical protein
LEFNGALGWLASIFLFEAATKRIAQAHWGSDFIFAPYKLMNGVDGIRGSAQN